MTVAALSNVIDSPPADTAPSTVVVSLVADADIAYFATSGSGSVISTWAFQLTAPQLRIKTPCRDAQRPSMFAVPIPNNSIAYSALLEPSSTKLKFLMSKRRKPLMTRPFVAVFPLGTMTSNESIERRALCAEPSQIGELFSPDDVISTDKP